MKEVKLNERQRLFAEEHHRILTDFLKYKNLPMDEFYDVVVFGFLKAVQLYDKRRDLKQFSFRTIAKNQMYWCLCDHFRKLKKSNDVIGALSLDYPVSQYPNMTLGDTIADETVNICDEVCEKLSRTPNRYRLSHTYSFCAATRQMALREVV